MISFGPSPPGDGGIVRILRAPDFCCSPELEHCRDTLTRGSWNLSPIDKHTRRTLADALRASATAEITGLSRGIALVSTADRRLYVEVWLPATDFRRPGISTFEEWMRLIKEVKDDLNREALLRLKFLGVAEASIIAFAVGKKLATTDVELEIRPRSIQWSRDD